MIFFTFDESHIRKSRIDFTRIFYRRKSRTDKEGCITCSQEHKRITSSMWREHNQSQKIRRNRREIGGLHRSDKILETGRKRDLQRRSHRTLWFLQWSRDCIARSTLLRTRSLSRSSIFLHWSRRPWGGSRKLMILRNCTRRYRFGTKSDIIGITKNISHKK